MVSPRGIRFAALASALLLASSGCDSFGERRYLLPPERAELADYPARAAKHRVLSVLWRTPLAATGIMTSASSHHGSAAVNPGGTRIFAGNQSGAFFCLDARTGQVVWRKLGAGAFDGQPLVVSGMVLAGTTGGLLYAFRESDGEILWSHQTTASLDGRPVAANGLVLVTSNNNTLVALDLQTGAWRWSYRREVPSGRFQVKGCPTPLVVGENAYIGFSDGYLVKLSLADGSLLAARKLTEQGARFTDVDGDPLLMDDTLVVGVFGRGLVGLELEELQERWVVLVDGPSTPAERDGVLYYSTGDSRVEALRAKESRPLWRFDAGKGNLTAPVVAGPWLLFTSSEQSLIVLERSSGRLLQVFNPGKGSFSRPTVAGNRVYWISDGQILYSMSVVQ
jgi:outer membrane protein assembly factor BamB